ncbi:hypothetical protein O7632_15160 [Solwaraspora sp. WMMD406]|uniref:hypothetical protein n=1 Tax=Solwaraspora sp. WMMD406 TaxID=3016095 RepID=UPI002416CEAD|nr:hypothetical protein [Solwaraspora sp. WMMD406]MDG4765424.1 hypothetical protein [Solwaraspora sp. WMMD406]
MSWTDWSLLVVSQIAVLCVAVSIFVRDALKAYFLREKLICYVLCLGLLAVDALVLTGVVGPGWPPSARMSLGLLAIALQVFLVNDIFYRLSIIDSAAASPLQMMLGIDDWSLRRRRIRLDLYGVGLLVAVEIWLIASA